MKIRHFMIKALLTAGISSCMTMVAFAATLSKATIKVAKSGDEYTATAGSTADYSVDDYEYDEDNKVLLVTLYAENDNTWKSTLSTSAITVSPSSYTVKKVKRDDSDIITVTIDIASSQYSKEVKNLSLSKSTGRASWTGNAKSYDVRLYKNGEIIKTGVNTKNKYYDFRSYFKSSGTYYFSVRANNGTGETGSYEKSAKIEVTESQAQNIRNSSTTTANSSTNSGSPTSDGSGAWLKDQYGWWYCNADRSYTVNNWQQIDGKWYFFNQHGYMKTGWINVNNVWYYLGSDGAMLANAWTPDGYYVGTNGAWDTTIARNQSKAGQSADSGKTVAAGTTISGGVVVGKKYTTG